jgi:GNAT superfamily N-acetyltransferase
VARFRDVEPLGPSHDTSGFDCGVASLDRWLTHHAARAAAAGSARTFVLHDGEQERVIGYHALTAASIDHDEATRRASKGMPRHAIPAVLLARLAVDRTVQGHGLAAWLLRDAMLRTLSAADAVGIRVLLVHAIDDGARAFYERHGFEASPTDPLNLQMLVKDLRASVRAAER